MVLTGIGIVVGIVVFAILVVTVAAWWVAAIIGLGVILVLSMLDGFAQWSRLKDGVYS